VAGSAAIQARVMPLATEPEVQTVTRQGEAVHLSLHVPAALQWFVGHFPGLPLLPGVVQTSWAVQFAHQHWSLPPVFRYMSNMKFMRFILPDQSVELRLRYHADRQELAFEYHDGVAVCASGRLGFGAEPAS
jgi:3-hydroxymyristoyl/3-hydroxydecanoyl-(acyl carrier protein) dehydratase